MFEKYIWKKVRLICPIKYTDYLYHGLSIGFNNEMIEAIKNNPYVDIIGEGNHSGITFMRGRFSDWQTWTVIPEWIIDEGAALFV